MCVLLYLKRDAREDPQLPDKVVRAWSIWWPSEMLRDVTVLAR